MRRAALGRVSVVLILGLIALGMFALTILSRRGLAVRVTVAVVLAVLIFATGRKFLSGFGAPARPHHEGAPEEVDALDVFFVCGECGTEYKVTRLGELSVPRHCGEPMQVVRRAAHDPTLN